MKLNNHWSGYLMCYFEHCIIIEGYMHTIIITIIIIMINSYWGIHIIIIVSQVPRIAGNLEVFLLHLLSRRPWYSVPA